MISTHISSFVGLGFLAIALAPRLLSAGGVHTAATLRHVTPAPQTHPAGIVEQNGSVFFAENGVDRPNRAHRQQRPYCGVWAAPLSAEAIHQS
jgi:hypothetical protein